MKRYWIHALVALSWLAVAGCNDPISQSHIDGNVPAATQFDALLQSALLERFRATRGTNVSVRSELLRHEPTQAGVGLPKYYLWATARDGSGTVMEEGAVQVAAAETTHFDVLRFVSAHDIVTDATAAQVFPAALVDDIRKRAAAAVAAASASVPAPVR